MNAFDKLIGYISPQRAFTRERYRVALDAIRKYDAAARGRRTEGWIATGSSANTEIKSAHKMLRDRSRELVRNNPYAKRAIDVISTNVVGTGIRPAPSAPSKQADKAVKKLWSEWAEKATCDYDGKHNFYGLQRLIMRAVTEGGEALVLFKRVADPSLPVPLKLQVLEGDFIDSDKDSTIEASGNMVVQGVEFDKSGKRVAYWLFENHPGDSTIRMKASLTSKRVPAEQVLHIYRVDRAGQVRGIPEGVSAMLRLRDFDDYEDAQLMRQKIAACFTAFVSGDPDASLVGGESAFDEPERLEPGRIEYLADGKQVTLVSPPGVQGYDEYTKTILRSIAAGYGVTYEALTNDYSNVNFSSGRMGWLEFQRKVNEWQNQVLIPQLCDPVWAMFIEAARVAAKLRTPVSSSWTAPRREMIQPKEEVGALKDAVRCGLYSWQEVVRQLGQDPDQVLEELQADLAAFDEAGIKLEIDARVPVGNGITQPNTEDQNKVVDGNQK